MSWCGYALRRAAQGLGLLLIIITTNFGLIHLAPGDPAVVIAGKEGATTAEFVNQLRRDFGLDEPLYRQFLIYAGQVSRGNLGTSYHYKQPVADVLWSRLPPTLLLVGTSLAVALIGGVVLGVVASTLSTSKAEFLVSLAVLLCYAMPLFWLGLMLIIVFSVWLGWFPVYGMTAAATASRGLDYLKEVIHHLVLPALTLSLFYMAIYVRLTRESMIQTMRLDYVVVARAKGLSEAAVRFRHGLRNALIPVVTIGGMQLGQMVGGSVVVETVFAWPGMGRLLFEAAFNRDYPILMGGLMLSTAMVAVSNLLVDLAYRVLDPRIQYR